MKKNREGLTEEEQEAATCLEFFFWAFLIIAVATAIITILAK